jgi:hypothetical protein
MASAKPQATPEPNEIAEEGPTEPSVEQETSSAVDPVDVGTGRTEIYEATRPDGVRLRITRNLDTGRQHIEEV